MNRYDKGLVIFILISSLLMYTTMEWFVRYTTSDQIVAVVYSYDKEVLRIDLNVDKVYEVEGTLGIVFIEVENKRIRVEKETSPYHLCSIQGWVEYANIPIVCLPNHIVIIIENGSVDPNDPDVTS
ncbi:MAG: hypothetical protein FD179_1679 [Erysipelotrichaceae bacterium]|nr:MAG: hypothetical protein FD179_1679 [Erysipelotrichaceae bacterium]